MKRHLLVSSALVTFIAMGSALGADGTNPATPGAVSLSSQTFVRNAGQTPPSTEYRRPADEVVIIVPPPAPTLENENARVSPFDSGYHQLTDSEKSQLQQLAARLSGRRLERIEIVGFADVQQLTQEGKSRYASNQALSEARAKAAGEFLRHTPGMEAVPINVGGLGARKPLVACDDSQSTKSPALMKAYQDCLSANRRVEVRVWYAVEMPAKNACGESQAKDAGLPFRISVDGQPLETQDAANSADLTRCADVALEKADIQVRFDGLEVAPVLNITATPDAAVRGGNVTFTPYTNYPAFITKAELRVFPEGESTQKTPFAIVPMDKNVDKNLVAKIPTDPNITALQYVLRVYDKNGRFDETTPKLLKLLDKPRQMDDLESEKREELIGYGENHRGLHNISVSGGAITISGDKLAPDMAVWAMGRHVPVDKHGKFAYQQIVPDGNHTVSVITQAKDGTRAEFNRSLYIPSGDWFYVALGDLTAGKNHVDGPVQLVTQENSDRSKGRVYADGRAAFYAKGKVKGEWLLTASADTQEQPIKNMFSNFASKDPRYLLRRIDPNAYYPVYGDDSTTVEDAPTQGKFYVRLERGDSKVLWGNFQTKINGTDLVNYSRTLYGANVDYKSEATTSFGERKTEVNGFAADPGTLSSLEEFRGTGGSLYYLKGQDVVVGSERVRVETRDKDSGIVLQSKYLVYGEDYEINYLQGRVILRQPLSSTGSDATVVRTGSLSGNPQFLVVGYEYAPGVSAMDNLVKGGHASQWLNDYVKLGVTSYNQDNPGTEQDLKGVDTTLRYAAGTYVKLEAAKSKGPGDGALSSQNGGFDFNTIPQTTTANISANAYRAEIAANLAEIKDYLAGKLNAYVVKREEGFSAPGQLTNEEVTQSGVTANIPIGERFSADVKGDLKQGRTTGDVRSGEVAGNYKVTQDDTITVAVRNDDREIALAGGNSVLLSETGARTDVALKVLHAPIGPTGIKENYEVYGLGQATVDRDTGRDANNRYGVGGRYDVNDRVSLVGEATEGNAGLGGKAGAEYRPSDRTTYYTNYVMDTERTDLGYRGRSSDLTSGVKSRYTDSTSIFSEERYQNFDQGPSGLIHSYGLDIAATDEWTFGGRFENGTLSDPTAGDTDRTAVSFTTGYAQEKTKYSGVLEWRDDDNNVTGARTSWLVKNNLAYQTTPDWRFQGGLDFAISDSGLGGALDADYTELNLGYAYRPTLNDRLNALIKYTYLDEQSSPSQLSAGRIQNASDYQQRSHVIALDTIYDLTPRISVGGKIGYRLGELKDTALNTPWFRSQAWLAIMRTDLHIVRTWDIATEFRYLNAQEAKDVKYGALIGIYRHINENIKLGIGYNFTDFSDDLTNLDYRSHGPFINLIGKL